MNDKRRRNGPVSEMTMSRVMYLGRWWRRVRRRELYTHPCTPYTKAPHRRHPHSRSRWNGPPPSVLQGQVPSPVDPPPGCRFAGAAPHATDRCRTEKPELCDMGGGHRVACHLCR